LFGTISGILDESGFADIFLTPKASGALPAQPGVEA
jgi:hypothetical protein